MDSFVPERFILSSTSHNPRVLRRFHHYLTNKTGFTTPQQFGASSWAEVVPLYRLNLTQQLAEPAAMADPALATALRARYYWTARFGSWDVQRYYAQVSAALTKANGGVPLQAYVNNPTTHGRGFTAPIVDGAKTAGSSGSGGFDWIEAGEMNAGMVWAEDVR